ncbi:hypothetical protein IGS74_17895 [Aureimonas sp. OT7]|uniref:hypothetical protein n=1 Tax=Aureimonas sp. OT7 TaxID=2816454 RepID=UPI00177C3FAC|nr:hypothetical protein [Aureimonas sp. OT7]QOG06376.1 hypothetical protein IGS74_17895 [Aureimonas sp. OT7]
MKMGFPRFAAGIPVSSQADLRLAGFPAGRAERAEKAEGKIEETGTISGRFPKLLLSAHWLGDRFRHHGFERQSAAISCNALASLDFDRHHSRRLPDFPRFRSEAQP